MADFATINDAVGSGGSSSNGAVNPTSLYAANENQSSGQQAPYKTLSGATRGDQQIKGRYMVVDNKNVIRLVMGFDPGKF